MKKTLAVLVLLGTSVGAKAADPSQYLCVVEQSAGLHYDKQNQSWAPQSFSSARKYVLRRVNDDDRREWAGLFKMHPNATSIFVELGNNFPTALCEGLGFLSCRIYAGGDIAFDPQTLRFEIAHYGGYLDQGVWEHFRSEKPDDYDRLVKRGSIGNPDNPADLFFEIGRCSSF